MNSSQQSVEIPRAAALIVLVAASGNRMIAGSRATVLTGHSRDLCDAAATVKRTLTALGAAVTSHSTDTPAACARPDFVFVFAPEAIGDIPHTWWGADHDLPTLLIGAEPRITAAIVEAVVGSEHTRELDRPRPLIREFARQQQRIAVLDAGEIPNLEAARLGDAQASAKIRWALRGMPMVRQMSEENRAVFAAKKITVALLLEPKTAAFALALDRSGAEVTVFAPARETDTEVARALAAAGVTVCAPTAPVAGGAYGEQAAIVDRQNARRALGGGPEYLIDDGAHLIRLAHTECAEALGTLRGAAEETTSGVRPLQEMAHEGQLRTPVVAVNNAATKTMFDNLVGTGESCVFAMLELTPEVFADGTIVVYGFGPVGEGFAAAAAAMGAEIAVIESDPVRALRAVTLGYRVGTPEALLPSAVAAVSATGVWHTITEAHLALLPDSAVVAVAGGIDDEVALDELSRSGWRREKIHPRIDLWSRPADSGDKRSGAAHRVRVLAEGAGINYTAAEGNPIEVMDLSFATQLAAIVHLATAVTAAAEVIELPETVEQQIAAAALKARGVSVSPRASDVRPGGARQHWSVHRFREE